MKKTLKIGAVIIAILFIALQIKRPNFDDAPVDASKTLEAATQVPENVEAILTRSCKDCHSNETDYPWYAWVQPSAGYLAKHIKEGRMELNFSLWNTYDVRRQRHKLDEICEQSESREMPLASYLYIHWGAKLSDEEIKTLCEWTEAERARLAVLEAR